MTKPRSRVRLPTRFFVGVVVYLIVTAGLIIVTLATGGDFWWYWLPLGFAIILVVWGAALYRLNRSEVWDEESWFSVGLVEMFGYTSKRKKPKR